MTRTHILAPLVLLQALPTTLAWGSLAHETIAYIAQSFVQSSTAAFCATVLGDNSTSYLANYATWADDYDHTSAGSFSYNWHFVDAEDSPPSTCNVDLSRDCGSSGCIPTAIANQTQRLLDTSLEAEQRNYALRWIIHFFGDITQPLHNEALDVGGNTIDVTFGGESTNLHHIWDTNMPEKLVGGYAMTDAQKWATTLSQDIASGQYASQSASWVSGMNLNDAQDNALSWSTDANSYVCSYVLKGGVSAVSGKELDGDYYQGAIPIFTEQIAKSGYRLAKWLDLIAASTTSHRRRADGTLERQIYRRLDNWDERTMGHNTHC